MFKPPPIADNLFCYRLFFCLFFYIPPVIFFINLNHLFTYSLIHLFTSNIYIFLILKKKIE
nr:MAG TPA: hypothetical protein [Caudoviricetes sp.]